MSSTLRIEERFTLDAPPDRVWAHLVDPERTVVCLPGAELLEVEGEGTYRGRVRVAVGPVTVVYEGRMVFEERDDRARTARMLGKGREAKGSGTARMEMTSRASPTDEGGTEVVFEADVQVTGKIVRFGRGMIERVSQEIVRDFTACLAERVAADGATTPGLEDTSRAPGRRADVDGHAPPTPANALRFTWRAFVGWLKDRFGRT